MNNQLLKNVLSSEEFKKIKNFDDPKGTLTNLDNLFYGGLIIGIPMFLYWMFQIFGKWLFIIPVGYIVACYIGRLIKLAINTQKEINQGDIKG